MSRVVHKFPLKTSDIDDGGWISLPVGDVVLVAAQNPADALPTIWIDRVESAFCQKLVIVGTGHSIYDDLSHVGSAVCANGALVWHVYEITS